MATASEGVAMVWWCICAIVLGRTVETIEQSLFSKLDVLCGDGSEGGRLNYVTNALYSIVDDLYSDT